MGARRRLAPRAAAARAAVARRGVNAPTLAVQDGFAGTPLSGAGEWDAYVAAHAQATPFHSRAWCEAITRATGHRCHLVTARDRSEEHTSELQSLMRITYAVFGLKKKN